MINKRNSKINSKTKAMLATIICIVMISMVFLCSCQSADNTDSNHTPKPESTGTMRTAGSSELMTQITAERAFSMRAAEDDDESGNLGSIILGGITINEEDVKSFTVSDGWWEYEITSDSDSIWLFYTESDEGVDPIIILIDSDDNNLSLNDDWYGFEAMMLAIFDRDETYTLLVGFYDENGQPTMESSTTLTVTSIPNVLSNDSLTQEVTGALAMLFIPDQTGTWVFTTTESGQSDPNITIFDRYGLLLYEDDDGAGGMDAKLTEHLIGGVPYIIYVDFWNAPEYITTLQVTLLGS